MKSTAHGGIRSGAGRPYQFGEPTSSLRIPVSLKPHIVNELVKFRLRKETAKLDLVPVAIDPPPFEIPAFAVAVAAGFPSPADDYLQDGIDLNKMLVRNAPATFFYTVERDADSMNMAGIFGGCKIMVDRSIEPRSGVIVLALILGEGATVKELEIRGNRVRLIPRSTNPIHQPRTLKEGEEVSIIGVVTTAINQFKV